jgi:hypothetical protein
VAAHGICSALTADPRAVTHGAEEGDAPAFGSRLNGGSYVAVDSCHVPGLPAEVPRGRRPVPHPSPGGRWPVAGACPPQAGLVAGRRWPVAAVPAIANRELQLPRPEFGVIFFGAPTLCGAKPWDELPTSFRA